MTHESEPLKKIYAVAWANIQDRSRWQQLRDAARAAIAKAEATK